MPLVLTWHFLTDVRVTLATRGLHQTYDTKGGRVEKGRLKKKKNPEKFPIPRPKIPHHDVGREEIGAGGRSQNRKGGLRYPFGGRHRIVHV